MRMIALLGFLLVGCAAPHGSEQLRVSNAIVHMPFSDRVAAADYVIIGRLVEVNFEAPDQDGFLTTSLWVIEDVLKGGLVTNAAIGVRLASGRDPATGRWRSLPGEILASENEAQRMRQHERALLLLSAADRRPDPHYRQQAAALGGLPLQGHVGGGLGVYRIVGSRIMSDGTWEAPQTVAEARDIIRRSHVPVRDAPPPTDRLLI